MYYSIKIPTFLQAFFREIRSPAFIGDLALILSFPQSEGYCNDIRIYDGIPPVRFKQGAVEAAYVLSSTGTSAILTDPGLSIPGTGRAEDSLEAFSEIFGKTWNARGIKPGWNGETS
jgi:hypothetical protein